jgi:hypothetical protein
MQFSGGYADLAALPAEWNTQEISESGLCRETFPSLVAEFDKKN